MRNKTNDKYVFNDDNCKIYNYNKESDSYILMATYESLGLEKNMSAKLMETLATIYFTKRLH